MDSKNTLKQDTIMTTTKNIKKRKKTKVPRCSLECCNKKLKLSDMPCKCKFIYCSKHRLPHQHNCIQTPTINKDILNSIGGGNFQKITTI
jgi:predicted nucleic acid binding AN1-type Zn finger protein